MRVAFKVWHDTNTDPIAGNILSGEDVERQEASWAEAASIRALAGTGNDSSDLGT